MTRRAKLKYGEDSIQVRRIAWQSSVPEESDLWDPLVAALVFDLGEANQEDEEDQEVVPGYTGPQHLGGPKFPQTKAFCDAQGLPDFETILRLGRE